MEYCIVNVVKHYNTVYNAVQYSTVDVAGGHEELGAGDELGQVVVTRCCLGGQHGRMVHGQIHHHGR